ncbi:hypothetical protein [Hoeflea poritis]|uniref:Uncharacterized protein n=1 Tax=Hoeflea poritis TaxID=2993659 RepID=A0ABT4VQN7_9HYPH|nr:hypothetical protein [Hoeflea poritis]MDA4847017.1 hypothetical protein [Hoeflea poritis]
MEAAVRSPNIVRPEEARAFVLSAIVLSTGVFGVAFWYGVFGTVFFDQLFYVWVASTVALIASLFVPPIDALPKFMSWRGRFVLILPSVLMVTTALQGTDLATSEQGDWLVWGLNMAIIAVTLPYLLYVLILVAVPDIDRLTHPRLRIGVFAITGLIALAGYEIGVHHPRFLTCYDFKVSGSNVPDNCRPAAAAEGG